MIILLNLAGALSLIRSREITLAEGASLINASAITKHMTRGLVKSARTLYGDLHSLPA